MKAQGIDGMESDIWGYVSLKVIIQGIKRKQLIPEGTSSWGQAFPVFPTAMYMIDDSKGMTRSLVHCLQSHPFLASPSKAFQNAINRK